MQIGIATKYFGPIILSISSMLQDVFLFLITFCVIMVAFGCGVSFIFNMASGQSALERLLYNNSIQVTQLQCGMADADVSYLHWLV